MRTHYDPEADALYMRFSEDQIVDSQEVAPGVVLDFDSQNRIVGMEVLEASTRMTPDILPKAAAE